MLCTCFNPSRHRIYIYIYVYEVTRVIRMLCTYCAPVLIHRDADQVLYGGVCVCVSGCVWLCERERSCVFSPEEHQHILYGVWGGGAVRE